MCSSIIIGSNILITVQKNQNSTAKISGFLTLLKKIIYSFSPFTSPLHHQTLKKQIQEAGRGSQLVWSIHSQDTTWAWPTSNPPPLVPVIWWGVVPPPPDVTPRKGDYGVRDWVKGHHRRFVH